jgi:hypothetical protein
LAWCEEGRFAGPFRLCGIATTADRLKTGFQLVKVNFDKPRAYAVGGEAPGRDLAPQGAGMNVGVFGSSR